MKTCDLAPQLLLFERERGLSIRVGQPYQTRIDSSPADPCSCHPQREQAPA